jgi:hypothetical protein
MRWADWKRVIAASLFTLVIMDNLRQGELARSPRKTMLLVAANLVIVGFLLFYRDPRKRQNH